MSVKTIKEELQDCVLNGNYDRGVKLLDLCYDSGIAYNTIDSWLPFKQSIKRLMLLRMKHRKDTK